MAAERAVAPSTPLRDPSVAVLVELDVLNAFRHQRSIRWFTASGYLSLSWQAGGSS